jgi:hypothetical protein
MNTNMETEDSAASIVTGLWFGQPGDHGSITNKTDFALLQNIETGTGTNLEFSSNIIRSSFSMGRAAQRVQLTTHLHLMPRLRISGAIHLF